MFFLNLSLPEFLAVLGALSGAVAALYLLDRLRKKYTVSTLRFFTAGDRPPRMKHRRKLQQPWSLALQLLSLALLLAAIAQLRLGSPDRSSRDHVLILDTSAWMAARSGNGAQERLIDRARSAARDYLKRIPAADRVMVLRADALASPATVFETDREKIRQAIDASQPGFAALNLDQALDFASQAQRQHARRAGEIVFAGSARISGDSAPAKTPANLRFIPIDGPAEHCGLRKMGVRRSPSDPDVWDIFVAVKNYGATRRAAAVSVQFGGAPIAGRRFDLAPGAEESAVFEYRTRAAGWLEARLLARDAFTGDSRAVLELPARNLLPVAVYSAEPELLRPVFNAIPGVKATFLPVSRYAAGADTGIVLLDRFSPAEPPRAASLWIQPPPQRSPISAKVVEGKLKLSRWRSDSPLAAGLRAQDLEVENAEVLRAGAGDIAVAESEAGPLIVARSGPPKMAVFGFHPVRSAMKYRLTTPLLFANVLRWMEPNIFRSWESTAGTVGTVSLELESERDAAGLRVMQEDGKAVPFTVDGKSARFFSASPGIVRALTGDREYVYSLTLPQPGDAIWRPSKARRGLPGRAPEERSARDIWQWLALLGAAGLIAEWTLFGRMRRRAAMPAPGARKAGVRKAGWRKAS